MPMRVLQTSTFKAWLAELPDAKAAAAIVVRVQRLAAGNPGDVKPVGHGISELRVHVGAGWRVYFTRRGADIVLLLCGGSKRTQRSDIILAARLAASDDTGE